MLAKSLACRTDNPGLLSQSGADVQMHLKFLAENIYSSMTVKGETEISCITITTDLLNTM